jgi:transposase-like protein
VSNLAIEARKPMATDSKTSVTPSAMPESVNAQIEHVLQSGLGELSVRELLGLMLSGLGLAERKAYLARNGADKANGFYGRSLLVGSLPVEMRVPRSRSGEFRPSSLPGHYARGYPEESQALLLGLLGSSRSVSAAKDALRRMGLSSSERDLDTVAGALIEELELRNTRALDPDLLALFVDGKHIEIKDGDRLRPACIYLAIGLGKDGKKRVLTCLTKFGRENLEDWKAILRGLVESHLSKADAVEFQQRWRTVKASWSLDVGAHQFEELCDRFAESSPTFIAELRKKRDHYLAFLKYPELIRRSLSTTNAVEAVNGQLEIVRRNSGGYFQSDEVLKLKLGMAVAALETGRWNRPAAGIAASLHQMNAIFERRFEEAA